MTGASGFIGSWISRILSTDHEVLALTRDTSSLEKLRGINSIHISRIEPKFWPDFIMHSSPDILILNDWSGVGNQSRNDAEQFENVSRLSRLAIAGQDAGVKTVIGIGSQAELGPVGSSILDSTADNPTTLYGEAKVKTRIQLESLFTHSEVRFVWMRLFSTYGPLDEGSWLIPNIVDSLANNKSMKMTLGEQEWSYLHAYDLANAFATVIKDEKINGIVNLGNPKTILIREAGLIIGRILGKENLLDFGAIDYRPDQVMKLQPICETLTNAGWSPQIDFEFGVKQTIDWLQRKEISPIKSESGQLLDFNIPLRL